MQAYQTHGRVHAAIGYTFIIFGKNKKKVKFLKSKAADTQISGKFRGLGFILNHACLKRALVG